MKQLLAIALALTVVACLDEEPPQEAVREWPESVLPVPPEKLPAATPREWPVSVLPVPPEMLPAATAAEVANDAPVAEASVVAAGWPAIEACKFIGSDFGVAVRPYQHEYGDEYSCSTPYKNLQEGIDLPNNLAFYAIGQSGVATEVKLVLNINEPPKEQYAKNQLKKFSITIATAATGKSLPVKISRAISSGSPATIDSDGYRQELRRENWPSGNGYELHYVITKIGEG